MKNPMVLPFLKWVGGKRQLTDDILPKIPKSYSVYCEPFIGGGAVLFSLQPTKAIINDLNSELINVYRVIKNDLPLLLDDLRIHKNESSYYYRIRDLDRDKNKFSKLSDVEKASRTIYLNKTCYNGLFRVNNAGEFNTPFGRYKNPSIVNAPVLRAVNTYLTENDIQIECTDYAEILNKLPKRAFVYLDPPYDPVSSSASFTGYNVGGFDRDEQIRLKDECDKLNKRGIKFLLSNSATEFIKDLYSDYNIDIVHAKRAINSDCTKRGDVEEVLVRNYD